MRRDVRRNECAEVGTQRKPSSKLKLRVAFNTCPGVAGGAASRPEHRLAARRLSRLQPRESRGFERACRRQQPAGSTRDNHECRAGKDYSTHQTLLEPVVFMAGAAVLQHRTYRLL